MRPARTVAAACLLFAFSFAASASAQETGGDTAAPRSENEADRLFNDGVDHLRNGRYEQACPLIEQSYTLEPMPGALFTLAECEAERGRLATAVARYEEYLRMHASLPPDKKAKHGTRERKALAQLSKLRPQVPQLALVLSADTPSGTTVKRNGVVVPEEALGVAIAVDPGPQILTVQVPGGAETELRVTLEEGDNKRIELGMRQPAPPEPKAEETKAVPPVVLQKDQLAEPEEGGRKSVAIIAAGAGLAVAGLGVGVGLHLASNSKSQEAQTVWDDLGSGGGLGACRNPANAVRCDELRSAYDSKELFRGIAIAGYAAGGALAVGTLVYALMPWPKARSNRSEKGEGTPRVVQALVNVAPGSVGATLRGSF